MDNYASGFVEWSLPVRISIDQKALHFSVVPRLGPFIDDSEFLPGGGHLVRESSKKEYLVFRCCLISLRVCFLH